MLTSTALVLMMTIPGLALFYGGMVRKKNVLATVMQSFAVTCLVTVLWLIVGYSLAFTPGSTIIGG
jgi:Amt family ammonium transporter